MVRNLPATWETKVQSLSWEDPLEKGPTTHSSILDCRTPWTEEPGRLQSMGTKSQTQLSVTNTHTPAAVTGFFESKQSEDTAFIQQSGVICLENSVLWTELHLLPPNSFTEILTPNF